MGDTATTSFLSLKDELPANITSTCEPFSGEPEQYGLCLRRAGWTKLVGEAFLGPYGLNCTDCYMASSNASRDAILSRTSSLQAASWIIPRADRPSTFVMNGMLLAPLGYAPGPGNVVSLQMSSDFIGSPFHPDDGLVEYESISNSTPALRDILVGGGFV